MLGNGLFDTVGEDAQIAGVVFFFLWGMLFFAFGFTIRSLEENNIQLPKILGVGLLLNALIALLFVPTSGFWLLLPPALFILFKKP